ncbi:hypothetical protein SAY86_009703 [Trapa natans]|uniref:Uncharacterized protein n=1 Tax=Trapa natans TaxID=22666 RepID=A0AAN7QT30_TRANT|nr:hypothetical protein SAY86_009703 [Trapa natans]
MWRQKSFSVGVDSDQSISDDEEIDGDSSRSCFLSSSRANKKGGSQILSQLERLRDAGKTNSSMKCNLSMQKAAGFVPFSDKVELPSFRIDGSLLWPVKGSPKFFSDEEMISDDEDNNVFPKVSIISTANKDCEEKRKWDSPVESHVEVPGHEHPERSMAEFLDDLSERLPTGLPTEYNQFGSKGKQRIQLAMKRSIDVVEDSEDESESLDSDSPGEEERNFQILKVPSPEKKRQIIVDHFQDLLDASPWRDKNALVSSFNSSSFGLFGRLQMVIQNEKHRELGFMNNLHKSETLPSGTSCLHVLILSSYLEAKLKVCRCSFEKISGKQPEQNSPESIPLWGGEKTVIFNSRTCSNVDLEVGKVICIYSPWKEIQIEGDTESILLCTCFSQSHFDLTLLG